MDVDDGEPDFESSEEVPAYPVGYGSPPLHTRFKPGGRPKSKVGPQRSKNHDDFVREVALRKVRVKRGDKFLWVRNLDLVIDAVRPKAAKGDPIALQLMRRYAVAELDEYDRMPKGVLIVGEKLTQEEWDEKYGHLGRPPSAQGEPAPEP